MLGWLDWKFSHDGGWEERQKGAKSTKQSQMIEQNQSILLELPHFSPFLPSILFGAVAQRDSCDGCAHES